MVDCQMYCSNQALALDINFYAVTRVTCACAIGSRAKFTSIIIERSIVLKNYAGIKFEGVASFYPR